MPEVKIFYGLYSKRVGVGRQEIYIKGNGETKLFLTTRSISEPIIRMGTVHRDTIIRLVELFESEEFTELEEENIINPRASQRIIKLNLGDREFSISVMGATVPEFERLAGAIKLIDSIAHPEISQGTFFPRL